MQYPGLMTRPGRTLGHGVDTGLPARHQGLGNGFGAGRTRHAAHIIEHIADAGGVQRHHLGRLGEQLAGLGNLPRGDGSNLTDRLSQQ